MIFYWISFYLIFFKEIIKNVFIYGILFSLLKNSGDMIHEKLKKKNWKMLKKRHYLQQQFELHFWPGKHWNLDFSISIKVIENWISFHETSILNQLEFLAASYGQNMKQMQKITQTQHYLQFSLKISNGDQQ